MVACGQAFAIILGQCLLPSQAHIDWQQIHDDNDLISLLWLIQNYLYSGKTMKYPEHALMDAIMKFYTFHQTIHMMNTDYCSHFMVK
jgi:hypothetical protein